MIFRLAIPEDAVLLAALERQQPRCAGWKESGWQTELAEKSARIWCACAAETIVGFVALRAVAGVGEILNVGVHPGFTRQGVASGLLECVLAWAKTQGVTQLTLEVGAANLPALALYRKIGFKQVGVRKKFYANNEDALLMEWQP